MITLEALRTALLSGQPFGRLDELVRADLAGGQLKDKIRDELIALEDAVRATPGFGEDEEDALRDVIDALDDFCPSRYAYRNPPILPSEAEIAKLPRWARVAFAARCVRRVLPLLQTGWPPSNAVMPDVGWTVSVLERRAFTSLVQVEDIRLAKQDAEYTAKQALAIQARRFVSHIALAIDRAIEGGIGIASGHVELAAKDFGIEITHVLRRDFDALAHLARWQHWTDDTPVPPEVFGPLWPEGPPKGWPADADLPHRADLPLELLSGARDLERMTEDETVNLFNTINAYYIARTGDRLTLEDLRPLVAAAVLAEV